MLIDWFTTIAQVINFLILVWLLKRFLYKPILNAIDEREERIATKLSNAEMIQVDAKKESDELKNKIKEIDDQRASILSKATDDAESERERLFEDAREAAKRLTEKSREDLRREEKRFHQSIIQKTQKEVFAITRKVLMDLSGLTLESHIVDVFIRRLSEVNEEDISLLKSSSSSSASQGTVRSSIELTNTQQAEVKNAICEYFKNEVELQFEIVPNLLSGIELIINGQKLAWSIDDYLASLENEVHSLSIPGEQVL